MYFDALTMSCVADELSQTILSGRVQQVLQVDRQSVGLEVYAQRQRHYLLASAHAELGRLLLSSEKLRRGVDRSTGLLLLLRKYVRGAVLSSIEQPPFERILRLEFEHPDSGCCELIVEIMGRHSNLILVDSGGQILDSAKRVPPHMSAARPVLPGQPYAPPPPQAKLPPPDLTEYRLRQILAEAEEDTQLWRSLVAGLQGMSPLLAREIAFRAFGHPRTKVTDVDRLSPLLETISDILSPLTTGQWQPCLTLEAGTPIHYAPYPVSYRGQSKGMPSISQAIEAYTTVAASQAVASSQASDRPDAYAAARRPVRQAIAAARARLERRQKAIAKALHQATDGDQWRQWGEWVLAYAHAVEPGQRELVIETGDGEVLVIPLDPARTASENAQAYFIRYRKAQRAREGGPARLREIELALRDLDQLETDLELAGSRPAIDAVRAALIEGGYLRATKGQAPKPTREKPLTLTSDEGLTILIGRNSRQNDEVTFRRATGQDWWFHTRAVPGAHVIVRSQGGPLPEGTTRRAAELAAHFSRLRHEAEVLVDYTRRRHVRRIPGAAPGLVTYSHEKTIKVTPRGPQ